MGDEATRLVVKESIAEMARSRCISFWKRLSCAGGARSVEGVVLVRC